MIRLHPSKLAIVALILSAASPALAQYVWVDQHGVRQYSDRPPPASVPDSRIIKRAAPAINSGASAAPATSPSTSAVRQEMTLAEKEIAFRKRRMEQAEKERKAAAEARRAATNAKNCERAREYQELLASGRRLARTDENGERYFLVDGQREQELQKITRKLAACR